MQTVASYFQSKSCNGMNHVPESGAEKLVTLKNHYLGMLATVISHQQHY